MGWAPPRDGARTLWTRLTLPPASQFKESALRKQSLYLNFDPLLQDSPQGLTPSRYAWLVGGARAGAGPTWGPS